MEAQLILLTSAFILVSLTVGLYEILLYRKCANKCNEALKDLEPLANEVDNLHRRRFGRASSEITSVFPRAKAAK